MNKDSIIRKAFGIPQKICISLNFRGEKSVFCQILREKNQYIYIYTQTCHSIELKNLDLTKKKSGSGGKNRDHGPIGYKKK